MEQGLYSLDQLPDTVCVACAVVERGWPVLAIRRGDKKPVHAGRSLLPNHGDYWLRNPEAVVQAWYDTVDLTGRVGCQFALITGEPNDEGLAAVAIDADVDGEWFRLDDLLLQAGPEALEWANSTMLVQRDDGRGHLWGTVPADQCPPSRYLDEGRKIEWRGKGGYELLYPALHPSGRRYRPTRPGSVPERVPEGLLALAQGGEPRRPGPAGAVELDLSSPVGGRVAGGGGDLRARVEGVLRWLSQAQEGERNDRLNQAAGLVARFGGTEDDRARVEAAALALGLPQREVSATVRSGWEYGLANPMVPGVEVMPEEQKPDESSPEKAEKAPSLLVPTVPLLVPTVPRADKRSGLLDLSSWAVTRRLPTRPKPTLLRRTDGMALVYPNRVNGIYGPKESGKTWVAAATAVEVLRPLEGPPGKVAWIDIDFMEDDIAARLVLLGVDYSVVALRDHLRVYTPNDGKELAEAVKDVIAWGADFAVVDSLGELIPMGGGESNSPDAFTHVFRTFISPVLMVATVLGIDHTNKNAKLSAGPTGTEAKARPIRGSFLGVGVRGAPLAPGRGGALDLVIAKETPGVLRADAARRRAVKRHGLTAAGIFRLFYDRARAEDELGSLSYRVNPPDVHEPG